MIECKIAADSELRGVFALRREVFVHEQSVPAEIEFDEFEKDALHAIAYEGKNVIGCARLVEFGDYVKIGRVAVKKEFRLKGVGKTLMQFLMNIAESKNKYIMIHAQVSALDFYRKLGFVEEGHVFLEAGIKHKKMRK